MLVGLLAVLALLTVAVMRAAEPSPASRAVPPAPSVRPADLFMQSIAQDNGTLGWRQLCPSVQALLPESTLTRQADAERSVRARQGLTLTVDFLGARPRAGGGELRLYIVTGHWPNGTTLTRTYTVLTQASGCVEDAKFQ